MSALALLFLASLLAGIQNALAGGGSFLTFPALLLTGLDARAANVTSTIALFPGQITTAFALRHEAGGVENLSLRALFWISLLGGVLGALLLLATPVRVFDSLVPWLVLFATLVFLWGSFFKKSGEDSTPLSTGSAAFGQFLISVYGGYFGGGIGILMLAVLTLAGQNVRRASSTKMVLAAVMNASAVVTFLFSSDIAWMQAGIACVGAIIGGQIGARIIFKVPPEKLKIFIVALGFVLTVCLFLR